MDAQKPATPLRILYVDDSDFDLELYSRVLSKRGHFVQCCEAGEEALKYLSEAVFDVMIVDTIMPTMSGLKLVEHIKKTNGLIKFIVTSGFLDPRSKLIYRSFGIETFLFKPATDEEIISAVENCLV